MTPRAPRKQKLAQSEKVLAQNLQRRIKKPIVLDAIKSYRATLPPSRFRQLNVDENYQRVRMTSWVNDLIHTIKAGGSIPDPIAIAERPDGSLWIVDGQQRFWAADECKVSLEATIYKVPDPKSDDYATEKKLFFILNRTKSLTSVKKVSAWVGHLSVLLKRVVEAGAYEHRISDAHPGSLVYSAPTLARGVVALLAPNASASFDNIDSILRVSETLLASKDAQQKAQAFLLLVPRVFPNPPDARMLGVLALARVCRLRWEQRIDGPEKAIIARLRRVNVSKLVPTYASRFLTIIQGQYEQLWRGKK